MSEAIIVRDYDGLAVRQREDGYWDATGICRAADRRWNDYWRLDGTQEFLAELAAVAGYPATELVQTCQGGTPNLQGTWVHQRVAIDLARWCSPKFAVWINGHVEELLSRGTTTLDGAASTEAMIEAITARVLAAVIPSIVASRAARRPWRPVLTPGANVADGRSLLLALLDAPVADDGQEATVRQVVSCPDLYSIYRQDLEKRGLCVVFPRPGPRSTYGWEVRSLFVALPAGSRLVPALLTGTNWEGVTAVTCRHLLMSIPAATARQCRVDGRRQMGVLLPDVTSWQAA